MKLNKENLTLKFGQTTMKNLSLKTKLIIFASLAIILFFAFQFIPNKTTEKILTEKSKENLKKNEELVYRIVKNYTSSKSNNNKWFDELRTEMLGIKIGEKGFPFVINTEGKFIIHPKVEGKNWKEKKFIKYMLQNRNGFVEYISPKTGKPKYVAFKYLPEENWIIGTGMWADEYDSIISSSQYAMYISLALSILLFSAFVFYIKKKIVEPVACFQQKTKEISIGNLDVKFRITNSDEIGLLASGLQEMTQNIKISKIELEKEKKQIEQKVQEAVKYSEEQKEYLTTSVEIILNAMDKFSQGDLTIQLPDNYEGTIGKLFNGFNITVNNLSEMVNRINEAVDSTITVSTQIASSITELSSGTEMQNIQINEITTSIDEMIGTFSETSQSTTHAAKSAGDTGMLAEDGSKVVRSAVLAMDKIADVVSQAADKVIGLGENSDKIGEIIQVINEIADQTNLLALNAAIEAARAGEHGRGFAVVADEVRKLAERTTQSTQEISGMIQQIQGDTQTVVQTIKEGNKEVEEGKKLANSAGVAIDQIVKSTNLVVDEINQVATAGEEQSLISNNVSQSINIINNVASESLLGTQQIAEATHHLDSTTNELRNILEQFKTNKNIYSNSNQNELLQA